MARLLVGFTVLWLSCFHSFAEESKSISYLTRSEKAIVALGLKLYLASANPDADFERIQNMLQQGLNQTELLVKVDSYKQFLQQFSEDAAFTDYRLDQQSYESLQDLIRPVRYYSESERVQKKIDDYFATRFEKLKDQVEPYYLAKLITLLMQAGNKAEIKAEISKIFEQKIQQMSAEIIQSQSANVIVLTKLLKLYFKALPKTQKAEMVYQLSQQPVEANQMDLFLVMIQNSGPQLQKLLQIMGRHEDIPEKFKDIFQKLESQVKPVPWIQVQKLLKDQGVDLAEFLYFGHKPIGVGTMAQTHRAQFNDEKGVRLDTVIRFLKPQIAELLEMDHQILIKVCEKLDADPELKIFNLPSFSDLIEDIHQSVVEELDMSRTIKNQTSARKRYQKKYFIEFNGQKNEVMFIVPNSSFYKQNSKLMVQDLVFGKKPFKEFSQYKEIYPDLYRKVSEKIVEMWIEEAFFRGGFFHADLHQGNILAQVNDESIRVSLLDYGMVGQLSEKVQTSALLLALGIKIDNADVIAKHFLNLAKDPQQAPQLTEFKKKVKERLKTIDQKQATLEFWTTWALEQGLELDYEFIKLNRGLAAVESLLMDSKSIEDIESIAKRLITKNKVQTAKIALSEKQIKLSEYSELVKSMLVGKSSLKSCQSLF